VSEKLVDETREEGSGSPKVTHSLRPDIGAQWTEDARRRAEAKKMVVEVTLPSGRQVLAHRTHIRWLYKHGRIPDHLVGRVEEMIRLLDLADPNAAAASLTEAVKENPEEELVKWLDVVNACWIGCVVQPLFVDDEDREDALEAPFYVGDVEYFDKLYLFQWAEGVDRTVEEFFREQGEAMGMLANGESIPLLTTGDLRIDKFGRPVAGDSGRSSGVPVRELHPGQGRSATRKTSRNSKKATTNRTG